jgi:hypothetical protein
LKSVTDFAALPTSAQGERVGSPSEESKHADNLPNSKRSKEKGTPSDKDKAAAGKKTPGGTIIGADDPSA